jgi:hypothetical protein
MRIHELHQLGMSQRRERAHTRVGAQGGHPRIVLRPGLQFLLHSLDLLLQKTYQAQRLLAL